VSFLTQPHVRLQEWVAEERGYFREAGLDYEFEPEGLAGSAVSTSPVRTTGEAPVEVASTTFMMGFLVSEDADVGDVEKYFTGLRRAQRDIDFEPERYKHYWRREMPDDIQRPVDVRRFGPGERIVPEPYTREMFEQTHRWMRAWDLFDPGTATRPGYGKPS
jgi:hypothetical protein